MPIREPASSGSVKRVECARHDIETECYTTMMPAKTWTVFSLKNARCEFADAICGRPVYYSKRRWILNVLASWYLKRGCGWKVKKARDEMRQGIDSVLCIQDGAKNRVHALCSVQYFSLRSPDSESIFVSSRRVNHNVISFQ